MQPEEDADGTKLAETEEAVAVPAKATAPQRAMLHVEVIIWGTRDLAVQAVGSLQPAA
jgi:hypothetical protein